MLAALEHAFEDLSLGLGRMMPVIHQGEAAECGLACLTMVASYHGHRMDLAAVRRRFPVSLTGMTLLHLLGAAARLGLSGRPLRVELRALNTIHCPAILHWDLNHFVVLTRWRDGRGVIHDPARGRVALNEAELSEHFTGVALVLTPTAEFSRREEREAIRLGDLFRRVAGLPRAVATTLALSLALEVFQLLLPIGSQVVIDQVVVSADLDLLRLVALSLTLLVLMQAGVSAARDWGLMTLGATLSVQWSTSLLGHLLRLPLGYFEKRHVGDVQSRFGALEALRETFSNRFVSSLMDGAMAIGLLAMMLAFGGELAFVAVATTLTYLLLRCAAYAPYRRASEEAIVRHAREGSHFLESMRGACAIKVLGLEDARHAAWLNLLVDRINAKLAIQKLDILYGTANKVLFGLDRVLILALGAAAVVHNTLSLGTLVAFLAYKDQFAGRAAGLIDAAFQLRMLRLQAERLADIALTEPETEAAAPVGERREEPTRLTLRGVTYRYGAGDKPVFEGVDLEVERGKCLIVVGPSGCGKTTLLKVMAGLLPPSEGEMMADGAPLTPARLGEFRAGLACVLQEDRLFAGSLLENVTAFDAEVDHARVQHCTSLAAIDADLARMPMGLETLVGDMGSALSGGQKQRLLLARALYRRPGLLLLDEPTNHLDDASVERIVEMLGQLGCTRVVVTHDQRLLRIASRVHRLG
jgi:ATP-binding cassette subfamily B protein RaxB